MSIVKNIDKTVTYLKIHINTLNIAQVVKHLKLKLHKFKAPRVKTFKTLPKEKKKLYYYNNTTTKEIAKNMEYFMLKLLLVNEVISEHKSIIKIFNTGFTIG